jgi:hypothetical protein
MNTESSRHYDEIWVTDFEYRADPGERPVVVCMVAREMRSGRVVRLSRDQLLRLAVAPFRTDSRALFVSFYASAELTSFLSLGWPLPAHVLDVYVEFRCLSNGMELPHGNGLLGALAAFGIAGTTSEDKDAMRTLAQKPGEFTPQEMHALLDYCQADVEAAAALLVVMLPRLNLDHALLRGRYIKAVAHMEHNGIPVAVGDLDDVRKHWSQVKVRLIQKVDGIYGVYEATVFKRAAFKKYLDAQGIPWPRLGASDDLALDDETFRTMARMYPQLLPLYELRTSLAQLKLEALAVGQDGRNRTLLSPFRARTGRNQPSNAKFVFGPARWIRFLMEPPPGTALIYVDWSQQEFGIAAALSHDVNMIDAYQSGDPYLTLAIKAGAAPHDATKATHKVIRDRYKAVTLAVQYGQTEFGLAPRLGIHVLDARRLIDDHRRTYSQFWAWSDDVVHEALLRRRLTTTFGWNINVTGKANLRSLRNFPCQANGAEMLRIACCFMVESGIKLLAPIHDAVLVEAPLDRVDAVVAEVKRCMADASRQVLDGFELRTDAQIIAHPSRFHDERGEVMWNMVKSAVDELNAQEPNEDGECDHDAA